MTHIVTKENDLDDFSFHIFGFTDIAWTILQMTNEINLIFEMLYIHKINDEVKKMYLSEIKILTLLLSISSSQTIK